MQQDTCWNASIDRLYDSVGREAELSIALGEFRPFFDARGVTFLTVADMRNPSTSHIGSVGVSEASLVEYHSHFAAHDEWVLAAYRQAALGVGSIHRGSELVSRTALRRSYFWKEFLSRYGVADILSVVVELAKDQGPTTFLTFQRHANQKPFAEREARQLALLAPHFRNVLRLHRRLAPALALGATLTQVIQRLEVPVLFVAANECVVDTNPAAAKSLAEPNGWLRVQGSRLQAHTLRGWISLSAALSSLRSNPHGSVDLDLVNSTGGRQGAWLALRVVQGAATDQVAKYPALAVATLQPGSRNKAQALRDIHGLTATEARIALQIASGKTASDIASDSGVALTTMRTHIASALSKLGLTRQAQLVGRVLTV